MLYFVEQLPTLPPDAYADKCPWSKKETLEHWISERVLKLSCTADDMIPLAKACDFAGSRGDRVTSGKNRRRPNSVLSTFTNTGLLRDASRPPNNTSGPPAALERSFSKR